MVQADRTDPIDRDSPYAFRTANFAGKRAGPTRPVRAQDTPERKRGRALGRGLDNPINVAMLSGMAAGQTPGEIAESLGWASISTMYSRLHYLRARLGARTNYELIAIAVRDGLIP